MADPFATPFHNPSIYAVRERAGGARELLDFCVPANGHFPPPALLQAIQAELPDILKYYPDYAPVHQENLSRLVGTPAANIVPANGVTELITLLCAEAQGPIATDVPTFGRWTDLPLQNGVPLHTLERRKEREFRLSADDIVAATLAGRARTLVLCNPNNPTGACLSLAEVRQVVEALPQLDRIVIDESFIDFSGEESAESTRHRLAQRAWWSRAWGRRSDGTASAWATAWRTPEPQRRCAAGCRTGTSTASLLACCGTRGSTATGTSRASRRWRATATTCSPGFDRSGRCARIPRRPTFCSPSFPAALGAAVRDSLLQEHGLFVRECSNKMGSSESFLRLVVRKPADVERLVTGLCDRLPP